METYVRKTRSLIPQGSGLTLKYRHWRVEIIPRKGFGLRYQELLVRVSVDWSGFQVQRAQGYLAHKKVPPPKSTVGP